MHPRDPRPCPDSSHYFTVELDKGVHAFRVPSGPRSARVLEKMGHQVVACLEAMKTADSVGALLGVVSVLGGDGAACLGALVGLGWFHGSQDLEAVYRRDVVTYGEEVWEELEDAGYSFADIVLCGALVLSHVYQSISVDREALDRLDFFGPQTVDPS